MSEQIPARVAAIRKFRERNKELRENGECVTRERHLAYMFARGRYYQQAERLNRPTNEKPGPYILLLCQIIKGEFDQPAPEPREGCAYRMPNLEEDLEAQVTQWLNEKAPDQDEWLQSYADAKASRAIHRALMKDAWEQRRKVIEETSKNVEFIRSEGFVDDAYAQQLQDLLHGKAEPVTKVDDEE